MGTSPRGLIHARRQASRRWRGSVGLVLLAAKEEEKKDKKLCRYPPGFFFNYENIYNRNFLHFFKALDKSKNHRKIHGCS